MSIREKLSLVRQNWSGWCTVMAILALLYVLTAVHSTVKGQWLWTVISVSVVVWVGMWIYIKTVVNA